MDKISGGRVRMVARRVLGEVLVRVHWSNLSGGRGECEVYLISEDGVGQGQYLVGRSVIQIPEYSSGDQYGMASTLAMFYMTDVIVAPGDHLLIGKIEGLDVGTGEGGHAVWDYRVTLECEDEGPGRLIGYRMDIGVGRRVVLRGIGMKRVAG